MDAIPPLRPGILTPDPAALGGDGADLSVKELTHNAGNQATGGIWRGTGPAGSAVVKLATSAGGGDRASAPRGCWRPSSPGRAWSRCGWRTSPGGLALGEAVG